MLDICLGNPKKVAYNPHPVGFAQRTQDPYEHKKTVSKVDMMGVDHPSIVDRFPTSPHLFFFPQYQTAQVQKEAALWSSWKNIAHLYYTIYSLFGLL